MELNVHKINETYIIDILGEMDIYNASQLRSLFSKMLSKKVRSFIINMQNVDYIDSAGIGALIYICEKISKEDLQLAIVNVHGIVKTVIELTKLGFYFPIYDSIDEAVVKFQEEMSFMPI